MSRRATSSARDKVSKLPNAPLAEVVFELRWQLFGDERLGPFRRDPGYFGCLDGLIQKVDSIGFREHKASANTGAAGVPYSVEHRFYRSNSESFPVLQLGQGIFAVNESTQYSWSSFKELCLTAFELLISCYPKMAAFPFVPIQFELRYIDALRPVTSTKDLLQFLNESTHLEFHLPSFLSSERFGAIGDTQINVDFPVKGIKDSSFAVGFSKGTMSDVETFLMQSTFKSKVSPGVFGKRSPTARTVINKWFEDAHDITSPFFKAIIKDSLMANYREPVNA